MSTVAEVRLWERLIGAVALGDGEEFATFEYAPDFVGAHVEPSPIFMPVAPGTYRFPGLPRETFRGLPGMLADSLPDFFGREVIRAWLASQGRSERDLNPVEMLCYIGRRGMGALEFEPHMEMRDQPGDLDIGELVDLAAHILARRDSLDASLDGDGLEDIISVGTSAGGARAKAVIAWNPETNAVKPGQLHDGEGFEQWLLKFDGVANNRDRETADPIGFGRLEYAYSLMARACGITMPPTRLFEEGGRAHFMVKRFDRTDEGKLHMQSLGALAHLDLNQAGAHSYEQAFRVIDQIGCPPADREQLYRRMVFNIIARNQDDHVKNIAFLMDKRGSWRLSPAFDVAYAYNPDGEWTSRHQMSVNGKRQGFSADDLVVVGTDHALLTPALARTIIEEVAEAVADWPAHAEAAGVYEGDASGVARAHRLSHSR